MENERNAEPIRQNSWRRKSIPIDKMKKNGNPMEEQWKVNAPNCIVQITT